MALALFGAAPLSTLRRIKRRAAAFRQHAEP